MPEADKTTPEADEDPWWKAFSDNDLKCAYRLKCDEHRETCEKLEYVTRMRDRYEAELVARGLL